MKYVRAIAGIAVYVAVAPTGAQQLAPAAASYIGSWSQVAQGIEPCSGREAFPTDFVFVGMHPNGYLNGTYKIACVNRTGISGAFRSDGVRPYAQVDTTGSLVVVSMPAATYTFGADGKGAVQRQLTA
jgi:hypothetical protein